MNSDEITALCEIAKAATDEPWSICETMDGKIGIMAGICHIIAVKSDALYNRKGDANAKHIATFDPPTILALLSELEAAKARIARLANPTPEMWEAAWSASQDHFVGDDISKRGLELALKAFVRAALADQPAEGEG